MKILKNKKASKSFLKNIFGGTCRSRTGLQSFAGFCITALPRRHASYYREKRKKANLFAGKSSKNINILACVRIERYACVKQKYIGSTYFCSLQKS